MPTTQELVSIIKEDYSIKWSRLRILRFIDWAQKQLFNTDCAQHLFYFKDDPVFPYPVLKTTALQLDYVIDDDALVDSNGDDIAITYQGRSTTVRRIKRVFISVTSLAGSDYDRRWYGEEFTLVGVNEFYSRRLYRVFFYEVPIIIFNKTNAGEARLIFGEDPKTTTDRFYVECYLNPVELTGEEIPLSIDGDEWEEALTDGVVGKIESIRNGKSERLDKFLTYWMKKFKGNQDFPDEKRTPKQFPVRECG